MSALKIMAYSVLLFGLLSCRTALKVAEQEVDHLNHKHSGMHKYPIHRNIKTTYFYVGQQLDGRPGREGSANRSSAWTGDWVRAYGGVDLPHSREGYRPGDFIPLENPFYCALPYNDITPLGHREDALLIIPWAEHFQRQNPGTFISYCKNRWIRIMYRGRVCYAQWEDVGPFQTNDADYVFGTARPRNPRNGGVGLDVSPAVRDYLGMQGSAYTDWQFVDFTDVPDGPWLEVITVSHPRWE